MATRRVFPKPCVVCGDLSFESRCEAHRVVSKGGSHAKRGSGWHKQKMRRATLARDRHACVSCGLHDPSGRLLHSDHVIPLSHGGEDSLDNRATLCVDCHREKSARER